MFRKMRRFKQQISEEACREILKNENRGILSVIGDDGYPYGVPMDFYYDEKEQKIYFHCAKSGHKLDAIRVCEKVCFTVLDQGYKNEGDWFWHVNSVIVFGRAAQETDPVLIEEKLRALGAKYFPTAEDLEKELAEALSRVQVVSLSIEHMTGKLVKEK